MLLFSSLSFGQNYLPFSDTVPKRFAEVGNSSANDYFFYPTLTEIIGDSMYFHQYFRTSQYYGYADPSVCPNWGSDYGLLGDTTWLGREILFYENYNLLVLRNENNESLSFDLDVIIGDSSLFYQNASDKYFLKFISTQQESVLSVIDSVKTYQIVHYDNSNQVVNSALHNFNIKVGKTLGLIQFIDCTNFPSSEVGVELLGQLNPSIGYYQMTYDEMYPWQAGDIVEYQGTWNLGSTGPSPHTINYRLLSVTNRVETVDSVYIYYDAFTKTDTVDYGYTGSFGTFNIVYPNPLVYEKGELLTKVPFGCMPYDGWYSVATTGASCTSLEVNFYENFDFYCDSFQCMLPYDGFGTSAEHIQYEKDRGITSHWYEPYGSFGGNGAGMIYSKIAGVECGTIQYVGFEELANNVSINPNPFSNEIHINSAVAIKEISLLDLSGKVLGNYPVNFGNSTSLDLSYLNPGIYLINIVTKDGEVHSERIIHL